MSSEMRRNHEGRFMKGGPGGPGRPAKRTEERYLELTRKAVTDEDWTAIVERAKEQARNGNVHARKWLGEQLIGKDPIAIGELSKARPEYGLEQLKTLIAEFEGLAARYETMRRTAFREVESKRIGTNRNGERP